MGNPNIGILPEDNVGYPCDAYIYHLKRIELPNTLMGGTASMKKAGEKFLPKEPEESQEAYNSRLEKSYLLNAFKRTVLYLSGQIFSKPVILQDDNPQEVKDLAENIDLENNNLAVFAKKVFEAGLVDGITFVLVDFPPAPIGLTKEEEKKLGLRPYWVHVPIENLIGWKTEKYRGKTRLSQIRIKEIIEKPRGKYGTEPVSRIRVINLGSYQLYEDISKGKEEDWKLIESGNTTFTEEIPLAIYRPGEKITFMTSVPCLEDLAFLNLAHWQSNSDQTTILHYSRVPLLFGKMLAEDPNKVVIGPNRMIHSNREEASLEYVEHTGQAIGAGRDSLDDLEQRMSLYGLQLLIPKTGSITATEKALSSGENDCTLKTYGLIFQDFMEQCVVYTCQWLKLDNPGSVKINLEFRLLQTSDADVLIKAKMAGILPRHTVLQEFLYRGILNEDSDLDQIEEWLAEEDSNNALLGLGNLFSATTGLPVPQGAGLKNMRTLPTLPQPEGVIPEATVKTPKNPRPGLPSFTKKGK
jgi:hypothetical protein